MANDQALFEQLKQKYAPVIQETERQQAKVQNLHVENGKLFLRAIAPNQQAANRIWDAIKSVDPNASDMTADIQALAGGAGGAASAQGNAGGQTYTVKSGDTLSKIAKQFYGDANSYMEIFNANTDKLKDPNMIQPGQQLTIPPR